MSEDKEQLKKGTTTVAMVCKDGIVMATEMRATMGTLIAHKRTNKLFEIDEHLGMTVAGLVGDAQTLARYLKAEVKLFKIKNQKPVTVNGAATLMANILNGRSYYPYWVQLIIAGIDETGPHVFSLDAAGGSIEDDYVTTGSGSPYVYGVMEDHYRKDMKLEEGVELAVRGISMAMKRDSASGDGINLATIDKKHGFRRYSEEEVEKIRKKFQ
jgi:proteasome beta subunit